MNDTLEQRLADALASARDDERWAVRPRVDTLDRVRRGARRRRRRANVAAVAACALAVAGASSLVGGAVYAPSDRIDQYAASQAGQPVDGITPAWTPRSGEEWLLTGEEWDAFMAAHQVEERETGQSRVPTPAPLGPESQRLLDAVAPVLPDGTETTREDAEGGDPDATSVHVRLADGTPVEVERRQLHAPLAWDRLGGDATAASGWWVEPVPGSTSALLLQPRAAYGFGDGYGGANAVAVVTADGEWTYWAAPDVVSLETLRGWAVAADR